MIFAQYAAVTNLLLVLLSLVLLAFFSLSLSLFSTWISLGVFTCAFTVVFLFLLFDHLEQQSISSPSCLLFMSSMSKPPPIISLWVLLLSGLLPTHLPAHPSACQTTHQPGGFLRIESEFGRKKTQSSTVRVPATCGSRGWYRLTLYFLASLKNVTSFFIQMLSWFTKFCLNRTGMKYFMVCVIPVPQKLIKSSAASECSF